MPNVCTSRGVCVHYLFGQCLLHHTPYQLQLMSDKTAIRQKLDEWSHAIQEYMTEHNTTSFEVSFTQEELFERFPLPNVFVNYIPVRQLLHFYPCFIVRYYDRSVPLYGGIRYEFDRIWLKKCSLQQEAETAPPPKNKEKKRRLSSEDIKNVCRKIMKKHKQRC